MKCIAVHANDNVMTVLKPIEKGVDLQIDGIKLVAEQTIPVFHKIATADLQAGDWIIKYGSRIGRATTSIHRGEWVHVHNMETALSTFEQYTYSKAEKEIAVTSDPSLETTFWGYRRPGGAVGTRNEIWILPTVSCMNATARELEKLATARGIAAYDGIYALPHNAGCSQLGKDMETTQRILSGIARHPNAGGVLILSLGCENNNLEEFTPYLGNFNSRRVKFLISQNTENELELGLRYLEEISLDMRNDTREQVPARELRIGLKCGGSDALSGVTANPLCGRVVDRLVSQGGAAILTEIPEMFGAEIFLMQRCVDRACFDKTVNLIQTFKQYYIGYGQPIHENPAPGNRAGGITTLEEKSLGCIQKGGHAPVADVLDYGEEVTKGGLHLLNGPGNDSVSVTNLLSSGAQILLFTTGRGNPLGTMMPVIKISSNTALYQRKRHWIDFDAGGLLENGNWQQTTEALWSLILNVASGRQKTRNEVNNQRDIMIFKDGVLL